MKPFRWFYLGSSYLINGVHHNRKELDEHSMVVLLSQEANIFGYEQPEKICGLYPQQGTEGAPKGRNEGNWINTLKLKSLIMAQIERWRQASYMQVER